MYLLKKLVVTSIKQYNQLIHKKHLEQAKTYYVKKEEIKCNNIIKQYEND